MKSTRTVHETHREDDLVIQHGSDHDKCNEAQASRIHAKANPIHILDYEHSPKRCFEEFEQMLKYFSINP